jgi:hypothetical protein
MKKPKRAFLEDGDDLADQGGKHVPHGLRQQHQPQGGALPQPD